MLLQTCASQTTDAQLAQQCDVATRLISQGREEEALDIFQVALAATKNSRIRAGIFNGIGQIYCNRGQMDEAETLFRDAYELYPTSADAVANIGLICKWKGDLPEAERWLARALKLNPWHGAAQFTQAISALLAGDYKRGFELYECRFRSKGGLMKLETCWPEWDLTNGKNVYVYGEQGSGDIFLMLRYARLIKALGVRQSWVVHSAMVPLVKTIPEIDCVVGVGDPLPEFDCHIPAASLPRLFGTTLENIPTAPILPPATGVDYGPGFHVGIVWRGSKVQLNDRFRSTNLEAWAPVLNVPGVAFHSLQVDSADEALLYPVISTSEKPVDWMETARRVAGLDLVISVDTSMVHLCGSLGVPCWCALHCRPYFVFPFVRDDCPWYPFVRLFKQKREYEWKPVFERIADELRRHPGLV